MSDAVSFSIYNASQIIHNLSILIKHKCLVSVHFGEDQAFFLTAILEINAANNALIFDYGPKEALNRQLLNAAPVIFRADFAGIKVSFKGGKMMQILYKQAPAFTMPIPESIFWLQRREYFRVMSPQSKSSYCQLLLEGHPPVNLMLYDMSLKGISVLNTSAEISGLLVPGAQLYQCRLVLSGTGEDTISLKIRYKLILNPGKIAALKIQKIGCLITRITPVFEAAVQRHINQLQRENIRKMSGLE